MKTYADLVDHFEAIGALRQVDRLLRWDRSVAMPPAGSEQRAREISVLNVKIHDMVSDPRIGEVVAAVDTPSLGEWERANLGLIQQQHLLATAVPADLLARKLQQEARTEMLWRQTRQDNNFAVLAPELECLFSLVRDYADARSDALDVSPYDALMAHYLPGMLSSEVDVIFDDLAVFLPDAVERILARQKPLPPHGGPFGVEHQKQACELVARQLGFGLEDWGRLDVSAHPFSTGTGDDVRITTRYDTHDFMGALQATAHEVGHGFYNRHVPKAWRCQPVGVSANMGMGIHESQSLGLEMQMGRSRAYWSYLAPVLAGVFGGQGDDWTAEGLYRRAIHVTPSLIRIEADEVTYPLHIILRYRLEKDLLAGRLAVRDLPEAWRAAHEQLLGVRPPSDRDGCMQDIHWHAGMVGYFPAYAIGAVIAAQLTAAMRNDIPDLDARIGEGDFFAYTAWMRDHVQSKACLHQPADLIKRVTGHALSAAPFKEHLTRRYLSA